MASPISPRATTYLLSSLRHSVEGRFPIRIRSRIERADWKKSVLKIEGIRVDFNADRFIRSSEEDFPARAAEAQRNLFLLLDDEEFLDSVAGIRFRVSPGARTREDIPSDFFAEGLNIADAIAILAKHLESAHAQELPLDYSSDINRIKEIIPDQKIAPAKFDVAENKLILVDQPNLVRPDDEVNVRHARNALLSSGEKIIRELTQSNCDRRLIDSFSELQTGIASNDNIIELGLLNIGCEAICNISKDELPDAVKGMIDGHTVAVAMFVAQFPEWQKFSENAASVSMGADDIAKIAKSASAVAAKLENRPDLSDPDVPHTIRALVSLIQTPGKASKRAAFAVLRTIENLVSKVISYGLSLIDSTATKTIDGLSSAASKAIVIGLMTLAINSVTDLGSVTSKISEASWMRTAVSAVKKHIEGLE